jgi:hypothetical protein
MSEQVLVLPTLSVVIFIFIFCGNLEFCRMQFRNCWIYLPLIIEMLVFEVLFHYDVNIIFFSGIPARSCDCSCSAVCFICAG